MADSGIYEILNLVNGKRYIGSAIDFGRRWKEHLRQLKAGKHHSRHLQRSWDKHGADAFEFRVLDRCIPADLIAKEQAALDKFQPEMNISRTAGSTLGVKYTAESRARLSAVLKGKGIGRKRDALSIAATAAAHRGMRRSQETRDKIAAAATGKKRGPRSDSHRANLSAAFKGRQKSAEHMAALQAGRAGRVYTEEDRDRISVCLREQYENGSRSRDRSPEYREKIAASLRGRKATPEHRANQSAAQRGKKRGPYKLKSKAAQASLDL